MNYIVIGLSIMMLSACTTKGSSSQPAPRSLAQSEKVTICLGCHGADAKKDFVDAPKLAGRPYQELVIAIEKVRDYSPTQPSLMHDIKEEEVNGIATYFSSASQ